MEDNKIFVINHCLEMCVGYCKIYSSFLGECLLQNIHMFIENVYSSQKKKYIKKIINHIDSLERIEIKKYDKEQFEFLKNGLKEYIKISFKDKIINSSYSRHLVTLVDKKSFKNIVLAFLNECEKFTIKESKPKKIVKKNPTIDLPILSNEGKKKITYAQKDGLLYEHMIISEGTSTMIFNENSFLCEKEEYFECVQNGDFSLFQDLDSYELTILSPFERKRRIFVKSMFEIEREIYLLDENHLDDFYNVAETIVDNLYKELNDFHLDYFLTESLFQLTRKTYGSRQLLNSYHQAIERVGDVQHKVVIVSSNYFDNLNKHIPTKEDILKVVYNKIIDNIPIQMDIYIQNLNILFEQVCEYMTIDEIIYFYHSVQDVLSQRSLEKNYHNSLIDLQKYCCLKIVSLTGLSDNEVLSNYLREDRIF